MKILSLEESRLVLIPFFEQFGYDEKPVDDFLNAKSFLGWKKSTPVLWYPQNKQTRFIHEIYEDAVCFSTAQKNRNYVTVDATILLPILRELSKSDPFSKVYCLGADTGKVNRLIEATMQELPAVRKSIGGDGYFFPEDRSWLYCVTHENLSFFAGTKKLVASFKKAFPDYENYVLSEPVLGREN